MTVSSTDSSDEQVGGRPGPDPTVGFAQLVADLALSYTDESRTARSLCERIVAGAIAVIPGVVAAAVEQMVDGRLTAPITAGGDLVLELMDAQNDTGEGPCRQGWSEGEQLLAGDLLADARWPELADRLRRQGVAVRCVVSTPMEVGGRRVGVLSLVGDQVDFGRAGEHDVAALARIFATHAAIALGGAQRHSDMVAALENRDLIGQAKGILMERFKITAERAFAMLIDASSLSNTKLRLVCEQLSATGQLNGQARVRSRSRD